MSGRRASAPQRARASGWVRAVPIFAAVLVGAASFTLSFFAQSAVSAELGAVPKQWAFLVPLVVDGGVLAGSASIWASSTRGARKDPVAYLTIVGLLALSVIVNVHHASASGGVLGAVIAGSPPVVLLLTLELVAAQARRDAIDAHTAEVDVQPAVGAPQAAPPVPVVAPAAAAPAPAAPVRIAPAAPQAYPVRPSWEAPAFAASTADAAAPARDLTPADAYPLEVPTLPAAPRVVPAPPAAPAATAPAPTAVVVAAAPRAVEASAARSGSQADLIRAMFTEHLSADGDPKDTGLARRIADALDAPLPSVRKVLAAARKELEGSDVVTA